MATPTIKRLGEYIKDIDERAGKDTNFDLDDIRGISSITKLFQKTKANLVDVSPAGYKIVRPMQFAFNPNTARMGDRIPIALNLENTPVLASSIYPVFEIIDTNKLDPKYLWLWFKRSEFDRYARFKSHGSAREIFSWEEMCDVMLPIPDIETQHKIVRKYEKILHRIENIDEIIALLEEYLLKRFKKTIRENNKKEVQLSDVANIKYGKGLPTSALLEKGYPVYGGNGIIGFYNKFMYADPMLTISCRGASSGKINITSPKAYVTSNSLVLEPNINIVSMEYLKYYSLYKNEYYEFVTGSAQPQITIESLSKCTIELIDSDKMLYFTKVAKTINEYIFQLESEKNILSKLANVIIDSINGLNQEKGDAIS